MKAIKRSFLLSVSALMLCIAMLAGTTFAWFSDIAMSGGNIIQSGELDAEMYWSNDLLEVDSSEWIDASKGPVFTHNNWEPGYTDIKYIKIANDGSLKFKWKLTIEAQGVVMPISDVIDVYIVNPVNNELTSLDNLSSIGRLTDVLNNKTNTSGKLNPGQSTVLAIAFHMDERAGNTYQGMSLCEQGFAVKLVATQDVGESDSTGDNYDEGAGWPDITFGSNSASASVSTDANGLLTNEVSMSSADALIEAFLPAGVKLDNGVNTVTLKIADKPNSEANITLSETEASLSIDVHIDGVAEDNQVVMAIHVKELLPVGLNMGNYRFYHVENGATVEMTLLQEGSTPVHNNYEYDPATGDVILHLKSFSEVALVADTENAWNGTVATAFAGGTGTEADPYLIANADQFVYFGDLISNDNENYGDKYYKLIADINLGGDDDNADGYIFYPIGYYKVGGTIATVDLDDAPEFVYHEEDPDYARSSVSTIAEGDETNWYTYGGAFKGVFDGNGNTIKNVYQNTWQMKGNYDGHYYKEAMGIFGYVYGGTVKNLTVDNFTSDGEFTPTGVIAAYAAGDATFENIAITNCNPRVYNTGNGGIIGIAGSTTNADDDHITLKNITVDNSNKISALWGSWDVACGGLVGMYRGNVDSKGNATGDTISFENCHVAAQIDVYNDVCANYQYYAYRYAGMIIGSVRHNTKNSDGKTIPNMAGISASGCTVHFGTWNDYYYCEFEKNTMASYSEDYQFSRVPHSELKFTDSNGNGIIDTEEEKMSVTGCTHTHTAAEDKRAVYLPFHNLFTGYGWGVTSMAIDNWNGITELGVTEGDHDASVEKFQGKVNGDIANNMTIKLSDLFSFVDNGIKLIPGALTVTVINLDETTPVSATITYDRTNWENSTITFAGIGRVNITIQDYYFCTPTTIAVNITERQPEVKFESNFTGDFLYRVGNASGSTVALGTLFEEATLATIDSSNVTVSFETVTGNASASSFVANASDWTNGTIQFSGTGVIKVTITDNDYCIPTELMLEVIDATNITSAVGTTTGGDMVLLQDINTSTYVNYWNCTLYGNGFTYSLNGAPTAYNSKQGHGILITKNAVLDNLVIVGDVYNSYGAYSTQDYYNSAVDVVGETIIQNCYISGCSAPVKARSNVTIKNSTLYGGAVANLLIMSGTATLENVTTANYDDGRSVVGMGVVIHSDATETAKLVLNGTLTQYNFISESKVPTDTYAKNLHNAMFDSGCSNYHFGTSPNRYVNTGIISLTSTFNGEDITDNAKTGYAGKALTLSSYDGYVYTQPNTSGSVNNNCPDYKSVTQGAVPPNYSFDYTNKNYVAKVDGSNDYCYEENGKVNISMDEGDTFNWDTSILTIGKGITAYTVSMNSIDYTGKSIAFNVADDYIVTYTYTDNNNYKLDENGNITTYSVTYTKTVNITVAVVKATTKHAEFTFGSSNTASTTVTVGNNTYVMPNVSGTSSTIGSTTVNGTTIYYPIVEIIMSDGKTSHTSGWYAYFPVFSGAVTITDYADNGTGDKMTPYDGSTTTMPSGLSVVGDATQLFKYQSSSAAGSDPVVKNNILVYSSASISAKRSEYNTVIQYSYQDNAGATYYYYIGYHAPAQSYTSCVTPDTLVTLADGTQKRIDQVTYDDQLLVWNFYTGAYDVVSSSIVMNHGYDNYTVTTLNFADGTTVNTINGHGFFDVATNKYVIINESNAADYVGHEFIKLDADAYTTTTLVGYSVSNQYTESWSVLTAEHYNCIIEGMWSLTPAEVDNSPEWLMPYEIGEGMKYNEEKMQADIEKYGLYTYEDFADYCTYEQFIAFGFENFKVSVAKGYITWAEIEYLLSIHIK